MELLLRNIFAVVFCVVLLFETRLYAQPQGVMGGAFILSDGAGHSITMITPPGMSSNYTYTFPPAPGGSITAGYVAMGLTGGQTLYWNGSYWAPSTFIANSNTAIGLGFSSMPGSFAFPITLNANMGPSADNTIDLGDATHHFNTIYASNIVGVPSLVNYWQRVGTTLSPATGGDNVTTSGNISTSGTGVISSQAGMNLSGSASPLLANGAAGTAGQVLTSEGAGTTPSWTNVSATSIPFSGITTSTNTTAAMTLGTGSSILAGGGIIEATKFKGVGSTTDAVDLASNEVSGVLQIANGGTGSNTQNFVDLTTTQSVGGTKTFTSQIQGNISGTAASFTGSLAGDVTGVQSATVVGNVGGSSAANVHSAELLANAATNANTASTIVKRDASGNFSAGTITANLTGNVTGNVSGTASNVTGTVAIANGGTNATSASAALTNLLPAQSGHNGDVLTSNGTTASWQTVAGTGTVTSVDVSGGTTGLTTSGGPITGSGTITIDGTLGISNGGTGATSANAALNNLLPSQTGNSTKVLTTNGTNTSWQAAGNGTVTSVDVSGGTTGLTTSGGAITTSGTITLAGTLAVTNGGTGATSQAAAINNLLPSQSGNNTKVLGTDGSNVSWVSAGSGAVSSVALSAPSEFTVSGSPITTSGTLTLAKANQSANTVYAGPTSGVADQPTFRTLVSADIPNNAANTTGTASNVTGIVAETQGGTNQSTYATGDILYASAANTLSKLSGNTTITKKFLTQTGDGANSAAPSWGTIGNSDLANSSVTVNAGTGMSGGGTVALGGSITLTNAGVTSLTGTESQVNVSASNGDITLSTPQSIGTSSSPTFAGLTLGSPLSIGNGGTGQTTASAAFDALSPMTTIGDVIYGGASGTGTRLAGNTTATKKFLTQTGDGTNSAAPAWSTIGNSDLANSSVTVNAGTGMSGGGTVALGSSIMLTNAGVTSLSGTADQVAVSASTGAVTLSTPQAIATTSSPTFAGLTLSSPLTAANGGTGVATASANTVFAGPSSGAAVAPTFRSLVAADIPSLSASYINNSSSLQSGANFNIGGSGYIGGLLGVGTTTPQTTLHVWNTVAANSSGQEAVRISGSYSAGTPGSGPYIQFTDLSNGATASIHTPHESSAGHVGLSFWTLNGSPQESMRILSTGNIGINTNAPNEKLEVKDGNVLLSNSGTADQLQFQGTSTGISTFKAGAQGATTINYTLPTSQPATNNVLTATAISGTGPYNVTLGWVAGGGGGAGWGLSGNAIAAGQFLGTTNAQDLVLESNGSEVMRATTGGNLAIGTTSSTKRVTISGPGTSTSDNSNDLQLVGTGGYGAGLDFLPSGGAESFSMFATNSSSPFGANHLVTYNPDQGYIAALSYSGAFGATQAVGAGIITPVVTLDVLDQTAANIGGQEVVRITGNYDNTVLGSGPFIQFRDISGNARSAIHSPIESSAGVVGLGFYTSNNTTPAERLRILGNGNVGIGTSSPSQLLEVKDGALLLSNSGTAQQLQFQGTSSGVTTFKAGAQGSTTINYILPTAQGFANSRMQNDGSGNLSWSRVGQVLFARKTANQDYTSTSLTSDSHLSITLDTSAIYTFDAFLSFSDTNAYGLDAQIAFTVSTGDTLKFGWSSPFGVYSGTSDANVVTVVGSGTTGTSTIPIQNANSKETFILVKGIVIRGTTAGSLQLKCARVFGSTGNNLRLNKNSYLTVTRIQ